MANETKEVVKTTEEPKMCKRSEILGHALGALGHDAMSNLHGTWITPFMTDVMVLPSAFLGILLAAARILDGITDVAMGFIADSTKSKFGRYRAWLLRSGPLYALCLVLSFFIPSPNMVVRCVYAAVLYLITGSIAFTSVDIPFWSLPAAMTNNTEERGRITAFTTTASNAIAGVIGIAMPLLLKKFGGAGEPTAYLYPAMIVAAFGLAMYMICFALVREHVAPDPQQKFNVKLALKNIYLNKPLLLLQFSNIFVLFAIIMRFSFNYYYCQYNLGDLQYMSVLSTISLFCSPIGGLLFPVLAKHLGKKRTLITLAGVYTAASCVIFFSGWTNIIVIFACYAISGLCTGSAIVAVNAMMMDTIEYGEWKTGQRNEGLITATRCFVSKLVMAFVGVVIAAVMGLTGYVPLAEQSMHTMNAFHNVYSLGCAACMILAVVPMFFYDLTEKRHAEIMEELKARKGAK